MKKAFTLSEVLLVLSIIGVIAALTIPSLTNNIGNEQSVVAWKKNYSVLSQLMISAKYNNGGSIKGAFSDNATFANLFTSGLNVVKSCPDMQAQNCFATSIAGDASNNTSSVILNDGTSIAFAGYSPTCVETYGTLTNRCGRIGVDVNGLKAPNKEGKDIFWIHVFETTLKPYGTPGDTYDNPATGCNLPTEGRGCSAYYLYK